MTKNYQKIKIYKKIIPDFPLFFIFAKNKKYYNFIYKNNIEDLCQIISLCYYSTKIKKDFNRMLAKEIYYFVTKVLCDYYDYKNLISFAKKTEKQIVKQKPICSYKFVCDLCKKEKNEYKRKHLDRVVCGACKMKIKRLERKGVFI